MTDEHESTERKLGRRRLLRRAGGVAAGVAGATVVGAVASSPAQAAPGDNLVLGAANTSDTAATNLAANTASASTLQLQNTSVTVNPDFDLVGAPLRLMPAAATGRQQFVGGEPGSLGTIDNGTLYYIAETGFADFVYTSFTANLFVPIVPKRVLDTRTATGRATVLNPTGNLAADGKLIGNHSIDIKLSDIVFAATAVYVNLTVVLPAGGGFASILPGDTPITGAPATSNVNYTAGGVTPNFAVCGVAATPASSDVVKIFSSATAHILLDVFAFTVNSWSQVNPVVLASGTSGASGKSAASNRARLAQTGKPTWAK